MISGAQKIWMSTFAHLVGFAPKASFAPQATFGSPMGQWQGELRISGPLMGPLGWHDFPSNPYSRVDSAAPEARKVPMVRPADIADLAQSGMHPEARLVPMDASPPGLQSYVSVSQSSSVATDLPLKKGETPATFFWEHLEPLGLAQAEWPKSLEPKWPGGCVRMTTYKPWLVKRYPEVRTIKVELHKFV